jgi:hypothetical protein
MRAGAFRRLLCAESAQNLADFRRFPGVKCAAGGGAGTPGSVENRGRELFPRAATASKSSGHGFWGGVAAMSLNVAKCHTSAERLQDLQAIFICPDAYNITSNNVLWAGLVRNFPPAILPDSHHLTDLERPKWPLS